jgi:hypothetical protein
MKIAISLGRRSEKRWKIKKIKFYFYSKSPLLDIGGFAKQGIKKYSHYNKPLYKMHKKHDVTPE